MNDTSDSDADEPLSTTDRPERSVPTITGPWFERDRHGRLTDASYYRCTGCGIEAMRRRDVREQCRCGGDRS